MTESRDDKMKPILDRIPAQWGKWLPDPGWDELLLTLDAKLAALDPDYQILQAKEKFGTLRYYTSHSDDWDGDSDAFEQLISEAEDLSGYTCEMCGKPGTSRLGGWIKTLCDEHATKKG